MNRDNIKKKLHTWLSSMTMKYNWLQVKLEYKEDRGVFLVSFSPVSQIELSEEFNREAMQFADEMNATYGNEAPLFTDEEALFKLSDNAEVVGVCTSFVTVSNPLPSSTVISVQPRRAVCSWTSSTARTTAETGRNFRQTQLEVSFAYAA